MLGITGQTKAWSPTSKGALHTVVWTTRESAI